MNTLFSPTTIGTAALTNRIAMAPMTRSRAVHNNAVGALTATYYEQRASAGLIITEGTAPSPDGLGYARTPGIYSPEQIAGWKGVSSAVHAKGGKIFMQLLHVGRIAHSFNTPEGSTVYAPSAIAAVGQMWTDKEGMKDMPVPEALDSAAVAAAVVDFAQAAKNAIEAGFDGVELHGANGYLLEQFLNPHSNQRTDSYGGSVENRARFVLEVVDATVAAIGKERVGIRFSPYGTFNDQPNYPEIDATYQYLADELGRRGIAYIHLLDASRSGAHDDLFADIHKRFGGTIIVNGNYTKERAEQALASGLADVVAFGSAYIANPDLVERFKSGTALAQPDPTTFYTADAKGYTDYPMLN
jgi:N-ethylmaleimide reductase